MAFLIETEKLRFNEELRDGVAGKRVILTGADKGSGLGQAFALSAGLNGALRPACISSATLMDSIWS